MRSGIGSLHLWCDMPLVYRAAACDITFGITSAWEKSEYTCILQCILSCRSDVSAATL